MTGTLFDLDFTRWEIILLSLLPSFINIGIFFYVSFKLPQNRINFAFSTFVLLGALWQLGDGFVRLSTNAITALEWFRIEVAFSLFVVPFGILFILSSSSLRKKVSSRNMFLGQYLPSMVCLMLVLARLDEYVLEPSGHWYWIVSPKPTFVTAFIFGWLTINALLMLVLLWVNFAKSLPKNRNTAFLLAVGFTVPLIGGIISETVFPLFFGLDYIPIFTPLITTFTIASFLAIRGTDLLDYSPRHQWDQIVESMNEGILIVNNEGRVMYANNIFCELLEYSLDELNGKIAHQLLIEDYEQKKFIEQLIRERLEGRSGQYEILLRTKSGKMVWFIINGTPYLDKKGMVIGSIGIHTNIDNSKKADARFRALVENVGDIISLWDKEGNIIYVSPAMEKAIGYTFEFLRGKPMFDLMHPEQSEEWKKILSDVLAKPGVQIPRINRFRHKDGHYIWVEGTVTNLLENHNVKAVVSNYHDISERRAAEQKVIQKDERLRAILDNEPECVKVVDLDGVLLEINPAGMKMIDAVEEEEIVGKSILEIVHPEDRELYLNLHHRVCRGETGTDDFRIIGLKDTERWMESNSVPLRNANGKIYAVLSVARDITEIKKKGDELIGIKNKLEYSESRLKQAQAIAHVGNWELNLANNIGIWSDEACRIFGLMPEENNLSLQEWLRYIHRDDISFVISEIKKAQVSLSDSSIRHRIIRKDGEIRFIHSESRFDFDMDGKPIGLYGVIHDVTEEKLAELNLKNLLNVTNDQNNRLQNFAYIVSHNIRSHSANIIGIVNIFTDESDEDEKSRLFKMLKTSTDKLAETIENLNDIITIQNDTEKQKANINLKEEVDKTANAINEIISRTNTKIVNQLPSNIIVRLVPSYLESILLNILTNAVKYRSPNRDPVIIVSAHKVNEQLVISFQDNGLGLDLKKNKEKIFGMYKTFHSNKDARGFGLFITKNQIEAMGGKIEVESIPNEGSTFKIYINEEN